jgi:hypothetical protein
MVIFSAARKKTIDWACWATFPADDRIEKRIDLQGVEDDGYGFYVLEEANACFNPAARKFSSQGMTPGKGCNFWLIRS